MVKFKRLFMGCVLATVTFVMWLVSACVQSEANSVPSQPIKVNSSSITNLKTSEPPTLSNSLTIIPSTTTIQSSVVIDTPTPTPTTSAETPITTAPPITSTPAPTPSEGQTTPTDIDNYLLYINGLVSDPQTLTYAQILALPSTTQTVEIACPDVIDETDQWTGVPLSTLLNAAGLMPESSEVVLTGADGYYIVLPLETVLDKGVFLAYQMNGQALSEDRGYPLRLVVTGMDGGDWLRWVTNIEVKQALVSFSNIEKFSPNIPLNGSKLCSCFLSATVANYQILQGDESKSDQSNSLQNHEKA
jgi:Oxidoreductase molybdopterin binding domain